MPCACQFQHVKLQLSESAEDVISLIIPGANNLKEPIPSRQCFCISVRVVFTYEAELIDSRRYCASRRCWFVGKIREVATLLQKCRWLWQLMQGFIDTPSDASAREVIPSLAPSLSLPRTFSLSPTISSPLSSSL